jgi:hypothetical protein
MMLILLAPMCEPLHELLCSLKTLATSDIAPAPLYLCSLPLRYLDKRPGDVVTRQLIVDLLMILFDLYPPLLLPSIGPFP